MKKIFFKRFLTTCLIDVASFLLIIIPVILVLNLIKSLAQNVNLPSDLLTATESQLMELSSSLPKLFFLIIALITLIIIFSIIVLSVSRAIIWRIIFEKKLTLKYIIKSIPLGIIWFLAIMVLATIIFLTIKEPYNLYLLYVYSVLSAYLTLNLFKSYADLNKFNVFSELFKRSFNARISLYFIFLLAGAYIIYRLLQLVADNLSFKFLIPYFITYIIISLTYISFSRLLLKKRA
jgi:hypothetical protein